MRIGVLSDTHITNNDKEIPQLVLADLKHCDMIIHAGDIGCTEALDSLSQICQNIRAVWGNMDPPDLKKKLPEKQLISIGNFKLGIIHGFGNPEKLVALVAEAFKKDKVNLIIFGHSHIALNEKKGDILFFNPGSVTDKIFAPYNSYGIIEIDETIRAKIVKI